MQMFGLMKNMHRLVQYHFQRSLFARVYEVAIQKIILIAHSFSCKRKHNPNLDQESMKVIFRLLIFFSCTLKTAMPFWPGFSVSLCSFCCCSSSSFFCEYVLLAGKLHWKPCFNYATGISFDGYEIGRYSNVLWMKTTKLRRSTRLHAILMKMPNFVHGIDAAHVTNGFDQLSPTKGDVSHL